jgi:hypothetical protein
MRRILQDEIKHVQNLIHIAETALQDAAMFCEKIA